MTPPLNRRRIRRQALHEEDYNEVEERGAKTSPRGSNIATQTGRIQDTGIGKIVTKEIYNFIQRSEETMTAYTWAL